MQPSIKAEGLSKRYPVGSVGPSYHTVRASLMNALTFRQQKTNEGKHIRALDDVSFELEPGEVVGIIGRNGAGKTTLLKLLARITEPTAGRAELRGRVGSLLDLGTGFHSELTGRENIFLNGAILGMRRQEVARQIDEIVDFAGLPEFIDTPIKHYSAGMRIRLAFSVAAHLDTEILLADEVLAVGDAAFQKKCLEEMGTLAGRGRTVLLVSHNMGAIGQLCRKAMLIDHGRLADFGPTRSVISRYLAEFTSHASHATIDPPAADRGVAITSVFVSDAAGTISGEIDWHSEFNIAIELRVTTVAPALSVGVVLVNESGVRVSFSWALREARLGGGTYRIFGSLPAHMLVPGRYFVEVAAYHHGAEVYHTASECASFEVLNTTGEFSDDDVNYAHTNLNADWRLTESS